MVELPSPDDLTSQDETAGGPTRASPQGSNRQADRPLERNAGRGGGSGRGCKRDCVDQVGPMGSTPSWCDTRLMEEGDSFQGFRQGILAFFMAGFALDANFPSQPEEGDCSTYENNKEPRPSSEEGLPQLLLVAWACSNLASTSRLAPC